MSCYAPAWIKTDDLEHQGRGTMTGLLQEAPENPRRQQLRLNGYVLNVSFERGAPPSLADVANPGESPTATGNRAPTPAGGLVIATAPGRFTIQRIKLYRYRA